MSFEKFQNWSTKYTRERKYNIVTYTVTWLIDSQNLPFFFFESSIAISSESIWSYSPIRFKLEYLFYFSF